MTGKTMTLGALALIAGLFAAPAVAAPATVPTTAALATPALSTLSGAVPSYAGPYGVETDLGLVQEAKFRGRGFRGRGFRGHGFRAGRGFHNRGFRAQRGFRGSFKRGFRERGVRGGVVFGKPAFSFGKKVIVID
ncbi:MAG: hypothetical protein AAFS07_17225 [Pseudomonadota bacterium]